MRNLRKLDSYPKINKDFYSRTISGGIITLVTAILMFILFISELRLYLLAVTETKLVVDTSRGETLRINSATAYKNHCFVEDRSAHSSGYLDRRRCSFQIFIILAYIALSPTVWFDITFPALACFIVSLDEMGISGEQHFDVRHDIIKKRIYAYGNVIEAWQDGIGAPKCRWKGLCRDMVEGLNTTRHCGSCYGAEASDEDCCNSCEEVREAYQKKGWGLSNPDLIDQCNREGFLKRTKDEGEGCNIYGFLEVNKYSFNISHKINKLAFGDYFPGVVNPLDGVKWIHKTRYGMYQYFIKEVPTVYTDISGHSIQSNQFSVTEHFRGAKVGFAQSIPGVFFFYDLSPIKVTFMEQNVSFLHFLTNVCAIVGGIFTVSGILDSFIYHGQKTMKKKKMELGKFS
ncbi:hypothetical protein MRB53_034254 [Persea americana]|uniref:Uncharacterized protein n=1 Tax=Persea americana TaxID=3435 RepID=A0ACC2KY60_PERAE|nr:hypothetical protein MRB53_034254 [Persea americana]